MSIKSYDDMMVAKFTNQIEELQIKIKEIQAELDEVFPKYANAQSDFAQAYSDLKVSIDGFNALISLRQTLVAAQRGLNASSGFKFKEFTDEELIDMREKQDELYESLQFQSKILFDINNDMHSLDLSDASDDYKEKEMLKLHQIKVRAIDKFLLYIYGVIELTELKNK